MAKSRPHTKIALLEEALGHPGETTRDGLDEPIQHLRHVDNGSMASMLPGDIMLLPDDKLSKVQLDTIFCAVLACPRCGTLTPISPTQYSCGVPVICSSDHCSCRFRIDQENTVTYLPVM